MISNAFMPRTTPLTPLNNSPFSRGARAVHQGQKKAKACINVAIKCDLDTEVVFPPVSMKDGNHDGVPRQTESPPLNCDPSSLTPSSKGILKRKKETEMTDNDGYNSPSANSCSKKKVIFADPISATKIIDNVRAKRNIKNIRKFRIDPSIITPKASIVIKRLSEQEILELSRPKITTVSDFDLMSI